MATKKAISAGTGRRKTATARVNLVEGKGVWTVNGVAIEEYIDFAKKHGWAERTTP